MFNQVIIVTRKDLLFEDQEVRAFVRDLEENAYRHSPRVLVHVNTVPPTNPDKKTLFLSLGGDGTMLATIKQAVEFDRNALVLGVNLGRLGFLAENSFDREVLAKQLYQLIFEKEMSDLSLFVERRLMIFGKVRGGLVGPALNEILVSPNTLAAPFEYDVYVNDKFVTHHNSSGILVSTPTGSTAFSLSLGGPIMLPTARSMVIIPVAAHTLTARPIVVNETDKIRVEVKRTTRIDSVDIVVDGQVVNTLPTSDPISLEVGVDDRPAKIIHHQSWNFFDVLSEKLRWR